MKEKDSNIHSELIDEFLDNTKQQLNEVINFFILLEKNPHDRDAINAVFRIIHTIKGNASILSLDKIKKLAHVMEDLMNFVRQDVVDINKSIINVFIQGIDHLRSLVDNIRNGKNAMEDDGEYQSFLLRIALVFDNIRKTDSKLLWANVRESVDEFGQKFVTEDEKIQNLWKRVSKSIATFSEIFNKSQENIIEKKKLQKFNPKQQIENILNQEFEETLNDKDSEAIFVLLKELEEKVTDESIGIVKEILTEYESTVPIDGFTSFFAEIILEKMNLLQLKEELKQEAVSIKKEEDESSSSENKTIRVYESTISSFLDLVGELVVVGESYEHLYKRFSEEFGPIKSVSDLKKTNETFNDLSSDLQGGVLEIRRVPIKTLLERAPRIIRDVATLNDKVIRVEIRGEETLIDKSLLEAIEGPFIHIVRNAADHGIEMPKERQHKGKLEEGTIFIEIKETPEYLYVVIKDDGGGIRKENLLKKAVDRGLITLQKSTELSDNDIFNLLFEPGLSTAEIVTDISGRGVGMDVVKKNVESVGGQIHIESIPEKGSVFTLEIPKAVCVKIIEGFLVGSLGNRFVIPMDCVGESFRISKNDITTTPGQGECILHQGDVFSVRRLDQLLRLKNCSEKRGEGIGVVLTGGKKKTVLFVDDVLGTQKVVIKEIEGFVKHSELITGGAILGDERIAMVLNLDEVVK